MIIYKERFQFIIFILKFLISWFILGKIKTNGLITSSKYSITYLDLFFVSINFEITILSASTSQFLIPFLHHEILLLLPLFYQIPTLSGYQKILLSLLSSNLIRTFFKKLFIAKLVVIFIKIWHYLYSKTMHFFAFF